MDQRSNGYNAIVIDARLEDHVVGLEMELVELVEQRERAAVQHRPQDAARIQQEIDALQEEMARAADALARPDADVPDFHDIRRVGAA